MTKRKDWIIARAKIIKQTAIEGRITIKDGIVEGVCEDCNQWKPLDPDHRKKRSQGGLDVKENIDWVCRECHNKRDNMGDPKEKKTEVKKPTGRGRITVSIAKG